MERVLVTGASGLLGSTIVKIAETSFEVIPSHNTKRIHPNSLKADVTNKKEVLSVLQAADPDVVIHTASETNVDKCETNRDQAWRVNVEGTRNIAEACREMHAKLVYISTDYVFDGRQGLYTEEDEANPVNQYGLTKLKGEEQVRTLCKDHLILRTSVLYGSCPWKTSFSKWVMNSIERKQEITVVDDHYNSPTLTENMAEMTLEAAHRNFMGLYHASGSERISRYEFAKQIAKAFSLDEQLVKPIKLSEVTTWKAKRPRDSSLSLRKINLLKTKPLNIRQGLSKMKERET